MKIEALVTKRSKNSFELLISGSKYTSNFTISSSAVKMLYNSIKEASVGSQAKQYVPKKREPKVVNPEHIKEMKRKYAQKYRQNNLRKSQESARRSALKGLYTTKSCTVWMNGQAKYIDNNIIQAIKRLLNYSGGSNVEIRSIREKLIMDDQDILKFLDYMYTFKKYEPGTITNDMIEEAIHDKGKGRKNGKF